MLRDFLDTFSEEKMTSRELVRKTLEFASPQRIPRQIWILPWASDRYPDEVKQLQQEFPDDIIFSPPYYAEKAVVKGDQYAIGSFIDEWGCCFENRQAGIIGEVKDPLVKEITDIERVAPPRQMLTINIPKINAFCAATDKFVLASCCPRPFERLQFLRGTENVYMDFVAEPEKLKALLKKIHSFHLEELSLWAKTNVDGIMFMDDWGSQKSLLIKPDMWREFFKPLYKDYIDIAKQNGKKTFMHSDGAIIDIIGDLIELGLDAINCQIFCIGAEELGRRFKGKITFWGEIDRQHILPEGSLEDVQKAVKQVKQCLYHNGGIIAQCEFGPGAKPQNVTEVFRSWNSFLP